VEEWISERRNAEARRLLVETHEGVENIGTLVGYDDPTFSARP
jgi:transcriptional regulator GlxA family with amidase domain